MANQPFDHGDKVIFRGKVYDFGYYSQVEGSCVIYNEGECNMQDSHAVKISSLTKAPPSPLTCTCCPIHGA